MGLEAAGALAKMHKKQWMAIIAALCTTRLSQAAPIQASNLTSPSAQSNSRATEVVNMFKAAYGEYVAKAFGSDEVLPLSNGSANPRNHWGATIVDALDTVRLFLCPTRC